MVDDVTSQVDGIVVAFTTAVEFVAGSLQVFLNGQAMTVGDDYTETGTTGFTMAAAPLVGDSLVAVYEQPTGLVVASGVYPLP